MHRRTYEQYESFKYAVRVWYESILSQNKLFITKYIVRGYYERTEEAI